jgi:hypothetical protein
MWSQLLSKLANKPLAKAAKPVAFEQPDLKEEFSSECPAEMTPAGVAFAVDSVMPSDKQIWTETLSSSLGRRFRRNVVALAEPDQRVINALIHTWLDSKRSARISNQYRSSFEAMLGSSCHPLVDAVHVAFSRHYPLMLSPDCVWLAIEQGFANHVNENAETLRRRLVRHDGRQRLRAEVDGTALADFEQAVAQFSLQIRESTDPVLHETLVCDFSTTTPSIRTASEIVLMDAYSEYFEYEASCLCGIPKITIAGTPEDWRRIRSRVEVIATYGLEWWVSRLRPILDEFVLSAEGHPTLQFWQAIYKPAAAYGGEVATGWITDLFPYLGDAPHRMRNHVFDYDRQGWALPVDSGVETRNLPFSPLADKGVGLGGFPSGVSSVPVTLRFNNGSVANLDLLAGFLAVQQNPDDLTVSPVISWFVAESLPKSVASPTKIGDPGESR